jgi:UDP-N-acetyl-D-mannosaminuronic acid dehydrogenase
MDNICVIGLGYIGLPTASLFANNGFKVVGVDSNPAVVDSINSGKNHIEEVGLRTLLEAAVGSGHLRAVRHPEPADVFIIAVPTPFTADKRPDLSHVVDATESILKHLRPGNLVVLESTVPPGTTRDIAARIARERPDLLNDPGDPTRGLSVLVAHCPERVLPGKILKELVENDRVVGGISIEATDRAAGLYSSIVSGKIFKTDATTAEMVKLSENTFRDVNISLANELASVCERLGINVWEVIELANRHPRVRILNPGPGVGGHCIAVDPWFIVSEFPEETNLLRAARNRNDIMPERVASRVLELVKGIPNPKIALLGASYKGNVGDPRNSPALEIYAMLKQKLGGTAQLALNDMHVTDRRLPLEPLDQVLQNASLIVLLTDHQEYRSLVPREVAGRMRNKLVYDTRNALDHKEWKAAGFVVHLLGKGSRAG